MFGLPDSAAPKLSDQTDSKEQQQKRAVKLPHNSRPAVSSSRIPFRYTNAQTSFVTVVADASALPWITAAVQGGLTCSLQVHLNAGRQHRHCRGSDIRCLSYVSSLTAPASCKARWLNWRCLLAASHCKIPLHPGVRPSGTSVGLGQSAGYETRSSEQKSPADACHVTYGVPVLLTSSGD